MVPKFTKALLLACLLMVSTGLLASDHKEAPTVSERNPADIADLYAFLSPTDASKLVMVLTVNPFSVPVEGIGFNFSPSLQYRFNIDNDGDFLPDHSIDFKFERDQSFTAYFSNEFKISGQGTLPTEEAEPNEAIITSDPRGIRIFAGPRDDPFFFDVVGFFRTLSGSGTFTGSDGFAGFNVSAIVVEMPVDMLTDGGSVLNLWGLTGSAISFKDASKNASADKTFIRQMDRVGNPAVATALIPSNLKDPYNRTRPVHDAELYAGAIVASLQALGTSEENIGVLASVAVPDLLTIDTSAPTGFPNGRTLDDDVIDTLFFFIFNQQGVSDGVDANDTDFSEEFPFLAPPWQP